MLHHIRDDEMHSEENVLVVFGHNYAENTQKRIHFLQEEKQSSLQIWSSCQSSPKGFHGSSASIH